MQLHKRSHMQMQCYGLQCTCNANTNASTNPNGLTRRGSPNGARVDGLDEPR